MLRKLSVPMKACARSVGEYRRRGRERECALASLLELAGLGCSGGGSRSVGTHARGKRAEEEDEAGERGVPGLAGEEAGIDGVRSGGGGFGLSMSQLYSSVIGCTARRKSMPTSSSGVKPTVKAVNSSDVRSSAYGVCTSIVRWSRGQVCVE